jgi:phosphoserine aminotransferase
MTILDRIVNFSAGPAVIPESVLIEAKTNLVNYNGAGLSIMEMSHRSKEYDAVHESAIAGIRTLLDISSDYSVLFLQGGASMQFAMLPMNLAQKKSVDVIHSGSWTKKAIDELNKGYSHRVVASSEDYDFLQLPDLSSVTFNVDSAYTYMCSNNTIFGTQFKSFPTQARSPLVVDMSSDILSRKIKVSDFGIIFAGAQKNIGPSGVTLVIVRNDILNHCPDNIPIFFNLKTHSDANSLYNTPPTFSIYMANLVFQQLIENGGLDVQENLNNQKANILYESIDSSPHFYCPVPPSDRSTMNVVFRHSDHNDAIENQFIKTAESSGFHGLKGHRSVGGLRASIYNAQSMSNIERFSEFIQSFKPQ